PDGAITPRLEPSMTGPTRAGNRDVSRSDDADGEFADAVDAAMQPVAALHCADAGRCAGEDQIAGLEHEEAGEVADDLRHFPDELGEISLLPRRVVHLEPDRTGSRMTDRCGRRDLRAGSGRLERLSHLPRPPQLLGLGLQVAAG